MDRKNTGNRIKERKFFFSLFGLLAKIISGSYLQRLWRRHFPVVIFFLSHEIFQAFSSLTTRSNTSRTVMIAKVNIISTCADCEMHKYYRGINELLVISPEKGEILLQKIDQIVAVTK